MTYLPPCRTAESIVGAGLLNDSVRNGASISLSVLSYVEAEEVLPIRSNHQNNQLIFNNQANSRKTMLDFKAREQKRAGLIL